MLIVSLLLVVTQPAYAQREIRVPMVAEGPVPFLTTCVAPAARWAVVSDVANALIVAHRPKSPAHLSIFRLDAQGQVIAGDPVPLLLPKPAAMRKRPNFVLGLACHPRYPLLYVWQDVEEVPEGQRIDPAAVAQFDHLLIYSLEENPPKLLLATARGDDFHCGNEHGGFAFDAANNRLFVPSLRVMGPMKKFEPAIGWLQIAPDGAPVFVNPLLPPETAAPAALPDPAAAAASRLARIAAYEQSKATAMPLSLGKYVESYAVLAYWPCPYSYAPISADSILMASNSGTVTWTLSDRLSRFSDIQIPYVVLNRYPRIAAHPAKPMIYMTLVGYDGRLICLEHADGYVTLTPQTINLERVVINSPPLVLEKTNQIIVGAENKVFVMNLDARGRHKGQIVQTPVFNPTVEALAWSDKFGRLYVPVEKQP